MVPAAEVKSSRPAVAVNPEVVPPSTTAGAVPEAVTTEDAEVATPMTAVSVRDAVTEQAPDTKPEERAGDVVFAVV